MKRARVSCPGFVEGTRKTPGSAVSLMPCMPSLALSQAFQDLLSLTCPPPKPTHWNGVLWLLEGPPFISMPQFKLLFST